MSVDAPIDQEGLKCRIQKVNMQTQEAANALRESNRERNANMNISTMEHSVLNTAFFGESANLGLPKTSIILCADFVGSSEPLSEMLSSCQDFFLTSSVLCSMSSDFLTRYRFQLCVV